MPWFLTTVYVTYNQCQLNGVVCFSKVLKMVSVGTGVAYIQGFYDQVLEQCLAFITICFTVFLWKGQLISLDYYLLSSHTGLKIKIKWRNVIIFWRTHRIWETAWPQKSDLNIDFQIKFKDYDPTSN